MVDFSMKNRYNKIKNGLRCGIGEVHKERNDYNEQ